MSDNFSKVKDFVLDLGYTITKTIEEDQIIIINDEASGIKNCAIGCADPILILEQYLMEVNTESVDVFQNLLKKNIRKVKILSIALMYQRYWKLNLKYPLQQKPHPIRPKDN